MSDQDFNTDHLNEEQKRIADVILSVCRKTVGDDASGGGCVAFYTPEEWADRGERWGCDSLLIVVHDGGDLRSFFNLDVMEYGRSNAMWDALQEIKHYPQQCTSWYSAIYPTPSR